MPSKYPMKTMLCGVGAVHDHWALFRGAGRKKNVIKKKCSLKM